MTDRVDLCAFAVHNKINFIHSVTLNCVVWRNFKTHGTLLFHNFYFSWWHQFFSHEKFHSSEKKWLWNKGTTDMENNPLLEKINSFTHSVYFLFSHNQGISMREILKSHLIKNQVSTWNLSWYFHHSYISWWKKKTCVNLKNWK